MNFINYAEMAGYASEGFAKTEVTKSTSGETSTTTIYEGSPAQKTQYDAPPFQKNANGDQLTDGGDTTTVETWKIRRTVIIDDGTTIEATAQWAEGDWTARRQLTYKYL